MKRFLETLIFLIKKSLEYPFLWVGVIYLLWFVKLPILNDENFHGGVRLLGIYVIIVVLEKLLGGNKILSIVLFILILPIALVTGLLFLYLMGGTLGWLSSAPIYIWLILLFSGYAAYNLYQKSSSDNKKLRILLFFTILPILSLNVAQSVSYFPDVTDQKDWGNDRYYLVWEIRDFDSRSYYTLYKCGKSTFQCEELYSTSYDMYVDKLIIDKEKNEISIIDSHYEVGMSFTYGENPRRYERYPVQLGEHSYHLSVKYGYESCQTTDCDTDNNIYTMYECNFDYTSCDQLPVQYEMTSGLWVNMILNEATGEIEIYDDNDRLIFTYREYPVCYVDGCVILDQ